MPLTGILGTTELGSFGMRIEAERDGQDVRDLPVDTLRELARTSGLVLLRGFAGFPGAQEMTAWCQSWGEIMTWPFGAVLELVEAAEPTDHIFDHSYVPLHWDGMYKPYIPEFQIFSCVSAPGEDQGGRTTFCNTTRLLAETDPELVQQWRDVTVTYRIQNVVHYGGCAVSPLVVPHPITGVQTIRYNEPPREDDPDFLNRPSHQFDGVAAEAVPDFLAQLHKALYDERYFYAHAWREGDVVIADNYTLLHGRESFTHQAPRHIRRVHVLGEPAFDNPAIA